MSPFGIGTRAASLFEGTGRLASRCAECQDYYMPASDSFATMPDLLSRLQAAVKDGRKQLVFLVGSGLTAPAVPGTRGIVDLTRSLFEADPDDEAELERRLNQAVGAVAYQTAIKFVLDRRGPTTVNQVIRQAVLTACGFHDVDSASSDDSPPRVADIDEDYCRRLEVELTDKWILTPGVEALGLLLVVLLNTQAGPVLTTNFDPLIEVSIRRAGALAGSLMLDTDSRLDALDLPGALQVVHLHGFWRYSDTLHTPGQLQRPRRLLQASLTRLLDKCILVVAGYGGWSDVFSQSVINVLRTEQYGEINVLWTFYEEDEQRIRFEQKDLVEALEYAEGRVSLYKGIDCHTFLPELVSRVGPVSTASGSPHGAGLS